MRFFQSILTASAFLTVFAGIFVMSALATGMLLSAMSSRSLPMALGLSQ
jgi:hypothetical protein